MYGTVLALMQNISAVTGVRQWTKDLFLLTDHPKPILIYAYRYVGKQHMQYKDPLQIEGGLACIRCLLSFN